MSIIERLATLPEEERLITLEYLPTHLAKVGETDSLHRLLATIEFMEVKILAVGPQPLIDDYGLSAGWGWCALADD